jgi:hypothetical protein
MSESEETPINTIPPVATPPSPAHEPVTAEHISALHRRIDEIGHMIKTGFEALFRFVRKEAPAVEAGAEAVATALPVVGPVAKVIETVAGEAAAVASATCCVHADQPHGRNGCKAPGCSCSATN